MEDMKIYATWKKYLTFPLFSSLDFGETVFISDFWGDTNPQLERAKRPNTCVRQFFLIGSLYLKHSDYSLGCAESSVFICTGTTVQREKSSWFMHTGGWTTAWHSVCSLWPSAVPRSCNLGHSCFLLTLRHLSFAETNSWCIPARKKGRHLPGIRGKKLFI